MNVPLALALQSIPFAILAFSTIGDKREIFALAYASGLGLLVSAIVIIDGGLAQLPAVLLPHGPTP